MEITIVEKLDINKNQAKLHPKIDIGIWLREL